MQSRIGEERILLLEESICTPYNDLYVEVMTERAAFFRFQVFKRVKTTSCSGIFKSREICQLVI